MMHGPHFLLPYVRAESTWAACFCIRSIWVRYLFTQHVDWTALLTHSILFRHTIFTLPSGPVTLRAVGKFPSSSAKRFHEEIPLWFPWGSAQWKVTERTLTITAKILSAGIWNKDKENDSRFLEGCERFLKCPWFFHLFVLVRNLIRKPNMTNSLCTWFFYNMFRHLRWKAKANNFHLSRRWKRLFLRYQYIRGTTNNKNWKCFHLNSFGSGVIYHWYTLPVGFNGTTIGHCNIKYRSV